MTEAAPVEHSWAAITGWLAEHAPGDLAKLQGPAAAKDLAAVAHIAGRPVPADQVAWWRLSDGTDDRDHISLVPTDWTPASISHALARYEMLLRYLPDEPELSRWTARPAGTPSDAGWLPNWLPIAHNGGGDHLFLDLRRGPRSGCVTASRKDEVSPGDPAWPSVTAMLADVAGALVNGTDLGRRHASVEGGSLHWPWH